MSETTKSNQEAMTKDDSMPSELYDNMLSKRAHGYLKNAPSWAAAVGKVFMDPYDKETNPEGYINLGVAENVLVSDMLRERFEKLRKNKLVNPRLFGYGVFTGSPKLREEIKWLFEDRLMPNVKLSVDNIAIGNGSSAILEQLSYLLADEGDIVIIPAPYYMGFDGDIQTRAGAKVVSWGMRAVKTSDATNDDPELWRYELDFAALDALYEKFGSRVRGLIWTNPHNPTGQIFSEDDTKRVLAWCLKRSISVISDEVYGLSVYNAKIGPKFVSTLEVGEKYADELGGIDRVHSSVHMVYSFSKDFALNGYRIGVLCTKSPKLIAAFSTVSIFTQASNETQETVANLLSDREDIGHFLAQSNEILLATWNKLKRMLRDSNVPVVEPAAGMFLWCNLLQNDKNSANPESLDVEEEKRLWNTILNESKTYITPGFVFHAQDAGWFRICATCAPEETMLEGMNRILKARK